MKRYIVIGIIIFLIALFFGGIIWNLAWQVASAIFAFVSEVIFYVIIAFAVLTFAVLIRFLIWLIQKLEQVKK